MTRRTTHYDVLKVSRDTPQAAIRAAHRSLSQKHHPDRNPGDASAARAMAMLNAAYDVLGDPVKRQEYDEWLLRTESAESRVTPTPVPTVTQPSRWLIWRVIGLSSILGALALWFMLALSPKGLPTDAEVREKAEGGQFELRQDSQGRIIRLNRITGEVAVIQGNQVIPVSESSKANTRTATQIARPPKPEPMPVNQPIAAAEPAPRARPGETVTTSADAPIYLVPGYHTPLRVVGAGSVLRVVAVQDNWYQVAFKDPQWGTRVGFVAAASTRAGSTASSLSKPMDLSVRD